MLTQTSSESRGGARSARALFVCCLALLGSLPTRAQTPPAAAPETEAQAPAPDGALLERIGALERELARQRALLEAQSAALAEQKAQAQDPALAELIATAKEDSGDKLEGEPLLRAYGFADVGLQRLWTDKELGALVPESTKTTFVLGNVNVYLDATPAENVRFLAEVRFGLMPNGASQRSKGGLAPGLTVDTFVTDPSAANAGFTSIRWAGVVPQRAHIDYTPSDLFNVRAGLFLTPYGIWNVDHGTPTRITVSEPLFLTLQLIPTQLLGVEIFGSAQSLPWTFGYHVHVSNGRTPGQLDFTDSKALGGRIWASTRNPFSLKLGLSGYVGNSEDVESVISNRKVNYAFHEHAIAADVSLDVGKLRVRSEMVVSWTLYDHDKRDTISGVPLADTMKLGAYVMLAYQLPWLGLEPLVLCELLRFPVPRIIPVGQGVVTPALGLNLYFTPSTMLRTQFTLIHGFDFSSNPSDVHGFAYQAVSRLITAF